MRYFCYDLKSQKMKKQLLTLFAVALGSLAFSQTIQNGGFENWTTTSYENPQFWMSANSENTNNGAANPITVVKTTDAYHGSYAVKLTTALSGTDTTKA